MKIGWIIVYLILATLGAAQQSPVVPQARIVRITLDSDSVTLLNLKPGYVSSVRVPDEVSSVVLGDPASFKAEHSEGEPRLVFIKPTTSGPGETNALITTKNGREISLRLVNTGVSGQTPIDFVIDYHNPRSFLIDDPRLSFVVAETRNISNIPSPQQMLDSDLKKRMREMLDEPPEKRQHWQGKQLRVAIGRVSGDQQEMVVMFSVINTSSKAIELLQPQVQLKGVLKSKHGKSITADQIPVKQYIASSRKLPPHGRAEIAIAFERPSFKQASEQILLQVAQAEEVDHPVFLAIPFVAPREGDMR